jgi:hypothetical protein
LATVSALQATAATEEQPIDSTAALTAALEAMELDTLSEQDKNSRLVSVSQEKLADSTTPYISDLLDGRSVGAVRFQNVPIRSYHDSTSVTQRHFTVYLDQSTGVPIKVVSQIEDYDEAYWHKAPADTATLHLMRGSQDYLGLPETQPIVSALEVIKRIEWSLAPAEEIVLLYVLSSNMGRDPIRAWDAYFWGVPFAHFPGPRYRTEFGRCTVNAENGDALGCSNSPSPRKIEERE